MDELVQGKYEHRCSVDGNLRCHGQGLGCEAEELQEAVERCSGAMLKPSPLLAQ